MKRVFTTNKSIVKKNNKAINVLKSMMSDEDAIIANYMGAIKKNKKSRKTKKA